MSAKMPCVRGTDVEDPHQPDCRIPLDTPAWFRWLEAPTTSRFTYPVFDPRVGYIVGFMTVRNERRERGGDLLDSVSAARGTGAESLRGACACRDHRATGGDCADIPGWGRPAPGRRGVNRPFLLRNPRLECDGEG